MRSDLRLFWLAAATTLWVGCQVCPDVQSPPEGPLLLPESYSASFINLPTPRGGGPADPADIRAALEAPIIDVHVHTFNARYLPLRNILLGKRDATPWAVFLYDSLAKRIAAAVVAASKLSPLPDVVGLERQAEKSNYRALLLKSYSGNERAVIQQLDDSCVTAMEEICRTQDFDGLDQLPEQTTVDQRLDLLELAIEERLSKENLKDLGKALGKLEPFLSLGGVKAFLTALVARDGDLEAHYQRSFEDAVDLFVSHTMDLAPVYAQEEDGDLLLPFASSQIPRTAYFQSRAESRMLYFVAYNPFRDNRGHPGRALEIVREAIEVGGAWGVKVYPPSGYRPACNVIPYRPFAIFTDEPDRQWEARYLDVDGKLLDARLEALFDYCSANDIPIMTHCLDREFEARKGYSACFADPRWWRPVLAKYPKLRLCFGHAGHGDFWFGGHGEHESWGRLVYELCVQYENVYCEFGAHAQPLEQRNREHFIALLHALITAPRGKYRLETKLLYGSDWYMPSAADVAQTFLKSYQHAFTDRRLIAYYDNFFWKNALGYLDARERIASGFGSLPANLVARVQQLLDRLGGDPQALPVPGPQESVAANGAP